MKRSYLKVGDKSTANGVVVEGIPFCSHAGVEITFVGAKVNCPACNSIGHIVATGPRLQMNMMGKERALEGDLCACKCDPQPKMIASQSSMFETFDSHALASMGFAPNGLPIGASTSPHWIKFALSENGNCEGIQCAAHFADGTIEHGTFDANNAVRFARETSSPCTRVEILQSSGQSPSGSVLGDLMSAMWG
ncbi:PAAR domain-containing protein [Paraburkholderia sp. EG287A]|uniref:PAAR domain-containing protein n=1 Tax=Paraburkholderia sp. EG287A TaxID=3237012 RepID=UPI0034D2F5B6